MAEIITVSCPNCRISFTDAIKPGESFFCPSCGQKLADVPAVDNYLYEYIGISLAVVLVIALLLFIWK